MHECMKVHAHRTRQTLQIIAAFQHRDNAAPRVRVSKFHEAERGPCEIFFREFKAAQRITDMRIESRRDDHEVRREGIEGGEDDAVEGLAELDTAVTCPERRIEDVAHARFIARARTGIEGHLVSRTVEQVLVGPEDVLPAVTMMHIEIDDRDPLRIIARAGMQRRDCRLVEQAESHGLVLLGMVAGRPQRTEGV